MIERTEQEIMKNWEGDISTPLVSICTITYNHEKYIAEALDSFLMQQTNFPFEIIIDDDCSTDGTAEIINIYKEKYPNIIIPVYRKNNIGMMNNFVKNLQKAKGDFIALCEGDDYWIDENKLSYQIGKMIENNKCEISFHPSIQLFGEKKEGLIADYYQCNKIYGIKHVILNGGEFCPTASLVFKKIIFLKLQEILLKAPVADHYIQIVGASKEGALFLNRVMSIYRVGHAESWLSNMKRVDELSVETFILNRELHTRKHINTLKQLKTIIDEKYWLYLDMKISDRLVALAILYLKSNFFNEFKESMLQSKKYYNNNLFSIKLLYTLRNFPNLLKFLLKVRSNFASKKI